MLLVISFLLLTVEREVVGVAEALLAVVAMVQVTVFDRSGPGSADACVHGIRLGSRLGSGTSSVLVSVRRRLGWRLTFHAFAGIHPVMTRLNIGLVSVSASCKDRS